MDRYREMKKMLMIASVASMIDQFNMVNIGILKEQGYEVHVAANFEYGNTCSKQRIEEFKKELTELKVTYFHVDFSRKIAHIAENIKAYKQIKNLIRENNYEFVHCHSPIGGVCGRLAAHSANTRVIYTAHGFHFFKGAPLKNWLLYYPVERWLARYTDVLITINKEDYVRAKKSFKAGKVEYIPGVGIDTKKFSGVIIDKSAKRRELGVTEDASVILSVGELIKRKNHEVVIRALAKLKSSNIIYLICGQGDLHYYLEDKAKELNVNVKLLGFRKDVSEIFAATDLFVFPSLQEGLPVALMEAMSTGLPVVCSKIRGNTDLIEDGNGGYLVEPDDAEGFANSIKKILDGGMLNKRMSIENQSKIKQFDMENAMKEISKIYSNIIK